ncbi:hypothetical protein PI124_g19530 [Phytophthora idaei]|nr:hypothetical protein PI126_g18810 [Phytophthora idaei]KAG3235434.1 hypothetical protein PI124_g19530 [Phytophthora idaei]
MARGARGVTCRECGCLNFSSEHEVCDKCRSKALTFRPTARRLATSSGTSSSQRGEDSGSRVHSIGKKRRFDETKNASNKNNEDKDKREHERPAPAPPAAAVAAKKQPDVIDLISSDEEEESVVVKKVITESLKTTRREEEKEEDGGDRVLFQSRVFPTVTFAASDFPSLEEGTQMRKKAVETGFSHSQPTGGKAVITGGKSGQEKASQPTPAVSRVAEETIEPKSAVSRPPPIEEKEVKKTTIAATTGKKTAEKVEETKSTNVESKVDSATASKVEAQQTEEKAVSSEEEDPFFFQSRVFDAVEFSTSDFATVFDGLAVARRSHPPASSSSNAATSTSVGPAASEPKLSAGRKAREVTGSAKPTMVPASTATPAPSSTTAKTNPEVKPAPSSKEYPVPKRPITTTTTAAANTTTSFPNAKVPQAVSKAPATSAPTTTMQPPLSAIPTRKPTVVTPPAKAPSTQSTPAAATPSTKPESTPRQVNSASGVAVKPVVTTMAPTKSSPAPVVAKTAPATPMATTVKATAETTTKPAAAPVPVAVAESAALKESAAILSQTQANGSANVLLPKKKHPEGVQRTDEEKQRSEPAPVTVKTSANGDGVEFVKVNAAPCELLPVEPPVLGYCSPEFLAFMRECGGDDGDEDDDPEEVSRSQLKLLDVVDLTNLSDSEDSDAESPSPTPRGDTPHENLPANGQPGSVSQSAGVAIVKVSGTGAWYVPTLDSERKRSQPEKCAKENGDENVCWNCELGSMIDDSELDEEHAKHNSEYLAYLKAIRRSPSPEDDGNKEEEQGGDNQEQDGETAAGEEDAKMASPAEGGEDSEANNATKAGKRWMEFIGDATADIDTSYHEVTNRIAEELRDEEKSRFYSRGFVSREEFEAQMTEVEEYYINEEARLQQLEREKAIEAKKAAEARKAQETAEQAANGEQPVGSSATESNEPSAPTPVGGGVTNNVVLPPSSAVAPPSAPNGPTTVTTAPIAVPSTPSHPAVPSATRPAVPPPSLVPVGVPTTGFSAAFRAAVARSAPPYSKP